MLLLFDISRWQIIDDYDLLAQRTDGGFIKATEGVFKDNRFLTHWSETKKAGVKRGAYHFWQPGLDSKQQARFFYDTVLSSGDLGELLPALDIERPGRGIDVRTCIEEIERLFGRTPLIYTSAYSWGDDRLSGDKTWGRTYPLWIANYITNDFNPDTKEIDLLHWSEDLIDRHVKPYIKPNKPYLPPTWKNDGWKIWQVYQIGDGRDWGTRWPDSKQIDLDVFDGTLEELLELSGATAEQIEGITTATQETFTVTSPEASDALLDKLKQAGITPNVRIDIHKADYDLAAVEVLMAKLKESGITPEVHVYSQEASSGASQPGSTTTQPDSPVGTKTEKSEDHFSVEVTEVKTVLQKIKARDKVGKPIFIPREPRVILRKGTRVSVSATHKESDKDKGDGIIHATGNHEYYCVTGYPGDSNPTGLFIKGIDVKRV